MVAVEEKQVHTLALGKVIAALREKRSMTQTELAQASGLSQSSVSRLEAGRATPDIFELKKIAGALGVSTEELERRAEQALGVARTAARASAPQSAAGEWWAVLGMLAAGLLIAYGVARVIGDEPPTSGGPSPARKT